MQIKTLYKRWTCISSKGLFDEMTFWMAQKGWALFRKIKKGAIISN
jgi:hypothetical protein